MYYKALLIALLPASVYPMTKDKSIGKNTAGKPPEASFLLTSNGANTAATSPLNLALPKGDNLAYGNAGGAAVHGTSYVYGNPAPAPPAAPLLSYTAPAMGAPISYPLSFLEKKITEQHRTRSRSSTSTMPPLVGVGGAAMNPYHAVGVASPYVVPPSYAGVSSTAVYPPLTHPLLPPVADYPDTSTVHHNIVQHSIVPSLILPTHPGNGYAGFVAPQASYHASSSSGMYPTMVAAPYVVHPSAGNHFAYPSFLERETAGAGSRSSTAAATTQQHHRHLRDLPASAKWIQPPGKCFQIIVLTTINIFITINLTHTCISLLFMVLFSSSYFYNHKHNHQIQKIVSVRAFR